METREILDLLSGRRRGVAATLLRGGLRALTPLYRAVVAIRNVGFNRGWGVHRVSVPVISVGNLTTGGTGKTPLIGWLVGELRSQGIRVAVISRGYGSRDGAPNDEALELARRLPGLIHFQDPDRVAAAERAISEAGAELILLDDGFQHRRLARDLDLVLIDATNPFGFDALLPRGLLREPKKSLRRANAIILTRVEQIDRERLQTIADKVARLAPGVPQWEARTVPRRWVGPENVLPQEGLADQPVVAFCGIGNPDGFLNQLREVNVAVVDERIYPDHHAYTDQDWATLEASVAASGAVAAVCTGKDLVKLKRPLSVPVWALEVELELERGTELIHLVERVGRRTLRPS